MVIQKGFLLRRWLNTHHHVNSPVASVLNYKLGKLNQVTEVVGLVFLLCLPLASLIFMKSFYYLLLYFLSFNNSSAYIKTCTHSYTACPSTKIFKHWKSYSNTEQTLKVLTYKTDCQTKRDGAQTYRWHKNILYS